MGLAYFACMTHNLLNLYKKYAQISASFLR